MRVLVVEDVVDVGEAIVAALGRMGHAADWARDGQVACDLAFSYRYDLVVLDLMLPLVDGIQVLRELRNRRIDVPVLVLTARSRVDERVQLLDLGADDYLCKPFEFAELEARVRSLLRRGSGDRSNQLTFGDIAFDRQERIASVAATPLALSRREVTLLETLLANRTRIMSKAHLLESLFGMDGEPNENAVEVLVGRLRRKLTSAGTQVQVYNHRGLGYQLRAP